MDQVITALQTILDGLSAGISAVLSFTDGAKKYADAGADAAKGTGDMSSAFKTVFNFIAGLTGIGTLE